MCALLKGRWISNITYRKVASSRLSRLVAHFHIFRLFMKGKFDTYACTMTFGPKGQKLKSRPVYCSRLYGRLINLLTCRSSMFWLFLLLARTSPVFTELGLVEESIIGNTISWLISFLVSRYVVLFLLVFSIFSASSLVMLLFSSIVFLGSEIVSNDVPHCLAKGQLISEWNFGVFKSPKKPTKF